MGFLVGGNGCGVKERMVLVYVGDPMAFALDPPRRKARHDY